MTWKLMLEQFRLVNTSDIVCLKLCRKRNEQHRLKKKIQIKGNKEKLITKSNKVLGYCMSK